MQYSTTQDTLVGLFVASGIAALFFMSMKISNLGEFSEKNNYTISADFANSGGLKVKSPALMCRRWPERSERTVVSDRSS